MDHFCDTKLLTIEIQLVLLVMNCLVIQATSAKSGIKKNNHLQIIIVASNIRSCSAKTSHSVTLKVPQHSLFFLQGVPDYVWIIETSSFDVASWMVYKVAQHAANHTKNTGHREKPLLFSTSALGYFTCITQHTRQWLHTPHLKHHGFSVLLLNGHMC